MVMPSEIGAGWLENAPVQIQFFAVFSRLEYALKKTGYLLSGENAEPSWDTFARDLGNAFFQQICADPNIDELISRPPRKQVVRNGGLGWHPEHPNFPDSPRSTAELLVYVRRVRNNLFHGGKVPFDAHRDEALIYASLVVLRSVIAAASSQVRTAYSGPE